MLAYKCHTSSCISFSAAGYSPELENALHRFLLPNCQADELALCEQFDKPDQNKRWREGFIKSSFNYLLLDPRHVFSFTFCCLYLNNDCFVLLVPNIFSHCSFIEWQRIYHIEVNPWSLKNVFRHSSMRFSMLGRASVLDLTVTSMKLWNISKETRPPRSDVSLFDHSFCVIFSQWWMKRKLFFKMYTTCYDL